MFVRCDKMFDNFDNLGKILFIKNDVFEDLNENEINHSLDHFGKRPCLIISELDKMYLLPCTTKFNIKYPNNYFFVEDNWYLYNDLKKETYIKLNKIIEKEIFSGKFKAELNPITYYRILKKFINLYKDYNPELNYSYYNIIEEDIKEQVKKLEKII